MKTVLYVLDKHGNYTPFDFAGSAVNVFTTEESMLDFVKNYTSQQIGNFAIYTVQSDGFITTCNITVNYSLTTVS